MSNLKMLEVGREGEAGSGNIKSRTKVRKQKQSGKQGGLRERCSWALSGG